MELREVEQPDLEAPLLEPRADVVGAVRHQHGRSDHDRVGGEGRERLGLGEHQRLGHQLQDRPGRGVVEGVGADQGAGAVERAERQVEVVHPGVGDPQPAHPHAELGGEVLEAELLGARSVTDDQGAAEGERVAGLEVGADAVATDERGRAAVAVEPRLRRGGLHPALGVTHVRHHDVARAVGPLEAEPEVHRVDHVGRVGALVEHLDGAAELLDRGDQGVPLRAGPSGIGLHGRVHERVDRVLHPEVIGTDGDVRRAPCERCAHGLASSECLGNDQIVGQSDDPETTHGRAGTRPGRRVR